MFLITSKKSNHAHGKAKKIQVGEWVFDLYKLTITRGDGELSLEPKSVDLLSYLIEHPNRVIGKQELMDNVWRTIVSDNTISRSIVRLRRTLGDDSQNPVYIATIPRKGYRLIAPVQALNQLQERKTLPVWMATLGFIVLLVAIILGRIYWPQSTGADRPSVPMRLTPVTTLVGDETDPALSADGRLLAFAHRKSEDNLWRVMVKNLDTNELYAITPPTKNAWLPAWSPDSTKLVYQNLSLDYCHISIADVSNLNAPVINESVFDCNINVGSGNVIWGGTDVLYYAEAASENDPFVIYRYHISSKNLNQITSPPNSGRGDYRMQLSPDGKWLAFIRNAVYWAESELWLYAVDTAETKRITSLPIRLRALAWLPDSTQLVVANAYKQLQTVDIDTGVTAEITSEVLPLFHPSAGGGKLVASAGSFHNREIWRAQGAFDSEEPAATTLNPFIVSTQSDYLPRLNPKTASVAFVSERSGLPQVWLLDETGQSHQLTAFDQPYHFQSLNWSPDGRKLVTAANNRLIWIDVANRQVHSSAEKLQAVAKPVWDRDNQRIYFSQKMGLEWQLFSYSTANRTIVQITRAGGYRSRPGRSGNTIFLSKLPESGLWKFDMESGAEVLIDGEMKVQNFNRDWLILPSEQHFFYVDPKNVSSIQRFSLNDPSGTTMGVLQLKQDTIVDFDISQDHETLLYTRTVVGESDIVMLTPATE